jgi:hypothetical protein
MQAEERVERASGPLRRASRPPRFACGTRKTWVALCLVSKLCGIFPRGSCLRANLCQIESLMTDTNSRFLLLLAALTAVVNSTPFEAGAQTLIDGGEFSDFVSVGIDGDGTVLVAGHSDNTPVLFRLAGMSFESTTLIRLTTGLGYMRMSRDGRYVVATDFDSDAILLWSVTNLSAITSIFQTNAEYSARIVSRDVTSTTEGPLVLGTGQQGSFTWTPGRGFRYWVNSYDSPFRVNLYRMSTDGNRFTGEELARVGNNVVQRPIVATTEGYSFLDLRNGTKGSGNAISPDGSLIAGPIDLESAIWEDRKITRLSFAEDVHIPVEITESGWLVASSNVGSLIYNTHGRKLQRFDGWWASEFPQVPLPVGSRVQDLYEHQGRLYFLIHSPTDPYRSFLAIVPLSALKRDP